jgi:hypothetical protein
MNAIHEYALLFAVAVPLLAVIGLNLFLYLGGERGAGLFPSSRPFPVEELDVDATMRAPALHVAPAAAAANDEIALQAA